MKVKTDSIPAKTHYSIIPQFHYSMILDKFQTSKKTYVFIKL